MRKKLPKALAILLIASIIPCQFASTAFSKDKGPFSTVSLCKQAKLTMAQAEAKALKEVPGRVHRIELERDDGVLIYEVVICQGKTRKEITINAESGSIIEIDKKMIKCKHKD